MINTLLLINSGWVLLFVRIVLGGIMIYYGWPKIKDLKANAENFSSKEGFKPGWLWGTVAAFVGFFGGVAILIGFFAEVAATLMALQATVGIVWGITKMGKSFEGLSHDFLLLAVSLIIITFGSGTYSVMPLF